MIEETYKLIAVPFKLRRIDDTDYRKKAYKTALDIYYKREINEELLEKIIITNKGILDEYDRDKEIRNFSHNFVSSIRKSCLENLMD